MRSGESERQSALADLDCQSATQLRQRLSREYSRVEIKRIGPCHSRLSFTKAKYQNTVFTLPGGSFGCRSQTGYAARTLPLPLPFRTAPALSFWRSPASSLALPLLPSGSAAAT